MDVRFQKLHAKAMVPEHQSDEAAGVDLHACLESSIVIEPGMVELVPIGIAIELPKGFEGQVRPRSGLAYKHGITVLNSPGTIDSDYRGELKVMLINHSREAFVVEHGERVAQLVVARHETVDFVETEEFSESNRGTKGFGSTGK